MRSEWDLHVHLYGCLTPEDLWQLGKDIYRDRAEQLSWYEDEFEKATGRRPHARAYWEDANGGLEHLRQDFLMREAAPFPVFQAKFNLIIALCRLVPGQLTRVMALTFADQVRNGVTYCEYRNTLPPTTDSALLDSFLRTVSSECKAFGEATGGTHRASMAISIARDDGLVGDQYRLVKEWRRVHPDLAPFITAIDFCSDEEPFPPEHKTSFVNMLHEENVARPQDALPILYHVGESFSRISPMSAARWVYEVAAMGAHRLGHATALGIDPGSLVGRQINEPVAERSRHLRWLTKHVAVLGASGYTVDTTELRKQESALAGQTHWRHLFTKDDAADFYRLQDVLLGWVAQTQAVVESCPTSNFLIGQIHPYGAHPLARFLASGVKTILASDDPGIFDTTLAKEYTKAASLLGVGESQLRAMIDRTQTAHSSALLAEDMERRQHRSLN